jgi:WD40 repeat protein
MRKRPALFETCLITLAVGLNLHQSSAESAGINPNFDGLETLRIVISNDRNLAAVYGNRQDPPWDERESGGVELWDIQANEKKRTVMQRARVENPEVGSLAFSPDNQLLVCGRPDGTGLFWDVSTGEKMQSLGDYGGRLGAIAISPDGRMVAGGSRKDINITPEEHKIKERKSGSRRVAGGSRKDINITLEEHKTRERESGSQGFASYPQRYISFGEIRARDAQTNKLIWTAKWGLGWPSSLAFSPDGNILAAAGDGEVKVYDSKTGTLQQRLEGSFSDECPIAFSPDGKLLAGSNSGNAVIVCEVQSGKVRHTLEGHKNTIRSVSFSPDGKFVASAGSDNTVRLCHSVTGELEQVFVGLDSGSKGTNARRRGNTSLRAVTFSRDGEEVIAVGFRSSWSEIATNMTIQRWSIAKQPQQ